MRYLAFIAATVLTAMPAMAQETNVTGNAATENVAAPADTNAIVTNDVAVAPAPTTETTAATSESRPAHKPRSKTFPWGVLGLLGLAGLLGRFRR